MVDIKTTLFQQLVCDSGADEPGSPDNQNAHASSAKA
jgi:hypothetical protein